MSIDVDRSCPGQRFLPLLVGTLTVGLATQAGQDPRLVSAVAAPPPFARLLLTVAAALVGASLVLRAAHRLAAGPDAAGLVRGVRLVFLAVGAFAAAGGWLIGSPMPIVVALVIGGVDVVETSCLLLVTAVRGEVADPSAAGPPAAPPRGHRRAS